MWGAIIGDIIGSTFEIENHRSKFFELFRNDARFTDDSITTIAVGNILKKNEGYELTENDIKFLNLDLNGYKKEFEKEDFPNISPSLSSIELRSWCYPYRGRGFGGMFFEWIENGCARPYGSYGNGGLMRTSLVALWGVKKGWSKLKTVNTALAINNLTHNHMMSQKAIDVYISVMYECLKNPNKDLSEHIAYFESEMKDKEFNTSKSVYKYMVSSEYDLRASTAIETVFVSIREAKSFDEAIQNLVCCGGDTDTICAIGGALAEAIWGIPDEYKDNAKKYFRGYHKNLIDSLEQTYKYLEA